MTVEWDCFPARNAVATRPVLGRHEVVIAASGVPQATSFPRPPDWGLPRHPVARQAHGGPPQRPAAQKLGLSASGMWEPTEDAPKAAEEIADEWNGPNQVAQLNPEMDPGMVPPPGSSRQEAPCAPHEGVPQASRKADNGEPGFSYFGQLVMGKRHGYGTMVIDDGTIGAPRYEGRFVDDLRHGQGILVWTDGRKYCGQFARGRFHGEATMIWPDRRSYVGQYCDNRKHGTGTFRWPDGRCYRGQWLSGTRHGVGTYTNARGMTRVGDWDRDRPLRWGPMRSEPEPMEPQRLVDLPTDASKDFLAVGFGFGFPTEPADPRDGECSANPALVRRREADDVSEAVALYGSVCGKRGRTRDDLAALAAELGSSSGKRDVPRSLGRAMLERPARITLAGRGRPGTDLPRMDSPLGPELREGPEIFLA